MPLRGLAGREVVGDLSVLDLIGLVVDGGLLL